MNKQFDFIICGAGLSGMMLARQMIRDPFFHDKDILIIESKSKNSNDRTWCFWENENFNDYDIVHHSWIQGSYQSSDFTTSIDFNEAGYSYKIIRSKDFYHKYRQEIVKSNQIIWKREIVCEYRFISEGTEVKTNKNQYIAKNVFSSIPFPDLLKKNPSYPFLLQHFFGWIIRTPTEIFDERKMKLMDFSIPQYGETRFVYVLPFSKTQALVEYTVFSKKKLEVDEYTRELKQYLNNLGVSEYQTIETEMNSIPMNSYPLHKLSSGGLFYIGSVGGWTKPSTGYTYYRSLKQCSKIVDAIKKNQLVPKSASKRRFRFYDRIFLKVLETHNEKGREVFDELFRQNNPVKVLKFLSEETNLMQEIRILSSFSWRIKRFFFRALLKNG